MASWKDKFEQVKGKAELLKQAALAQGLATLEQHWQVVRELWEEKVDPSIRATVMDDEKLTTYLRIVHEALPLPLRLAIKEETFIRVCLQHRDRWLPALQESSGSESLQEAAGSSPALAAPPRCDPGRDPSHDPSHDLAHDPGHDQRGEATSAGQAPAGEAGEQAQPERGPKPSR